MSPTDCRAISARWPASSPPAPAIAEYSPAAAMRAVEEIEAMVARGFNSGVRLAGARPRWVWPIPPLAVYYRDDGRRMLAWPTPLLLAPSNDTGTYRGGPITPSRVRPGGGRDRHRLAPSGVAPLRLRGGHSVGEAAGRERRLRRFRAPGEVLDEWPLDAALEVGPGGGPREIQTDPCTEPTRAVGSVNPSRHAAVVPGHAPRGLDELGAPGPPASAASLASPVSG